jgi:hypothetical protein
VLTTVSLDHQSMFRAGEVDYEPADRKLTAEFVALQSPIPQHGP